MFTEQPYLKERRAKRLREEKNFIVSNLPLNKEADLCFLVNTHYKYKYNNYYYVYFYYSKVKVRVF